MAYWHEDSKWVGGHMLPATDHCFWVRIRITDQRISPKVCELYYLRRREDGPGPLPQLEPEAWLELWPEEPIVLDNLDEARKAAQDAIHQYELGDFVWDGLTEQSFSPSRTEKVEEFVHQNLRSVAVVCKRSDELFEVRYFEYVQIWEPRPGLPHKLRDDEWDWIQVRSHILTLADNFGEARAIALEELEALAPSAHTDPIASRIAT
ncbi:MAG TPA: hypothetical protein VGM37_21020 [Armatimonadota bacterium]